MNIPCDTEEPGFPSLSTTPSSIRNLEASLAAEEPPLSPTVSPTPSPRSPRRAKSMSGRDVWHLGKGVAGPRSYGSFSTKTKSTQRWDKATPGGPTVWDQHKKSEQAKSTKA